MTTFDITRLNLSHVPALADLLVETVASGGSVGFMHPLARDRATAFWEKALSGDRVIFGAFYGDDLAATVSLIHYLPENQPHRAEIGKMMTATRYRGQGAAKALLQVAETLAVQMGKTLLVLDTATIGGASGLYEKAGFTCAGIIPDFALLPQGGLSGTALYWKKIA